jgi:hypothetical protein
MRTRTKALLARLCRRYNSRPAGLKLPQALVAYGTAQTARRGLAGGPGRVGPCTLTARLSRRFLQSRNLLGVTVRTHWGVEGLRTGEIAARMGALLRNHRRKYAGANRGCCVEFYERVEAVAPPGVRPEATTDGVNFDRQPRLPGAGGAVGVSAQSIEKDRL